MDNFHINILAVGSDTLRKAIEIAFAHNAPGSKADSYEIKKIEVKPHSDTPDRFNGKTALVLRWTKRGQNDRPSVIDLPFRLDAEGAADFITRWLAEQDLGREPDHDGDNKRGWQIYTGAWGHFDGDHYAICAIFPAWAMYGK